MVITAHRSKLMARDELLPMSVCCLRGAITSFFWRLCTFENYTGWSVRATCDGLRREDIRTGTMDLFRMYENVRRIYYK